MRLWASTAGGATFPNQARVEQLKDLQARLEPKLQELSQAIKAQETSGDIGPPNDEVRRLHREARALHRHLHRAIEQLQQELGIPEALLEAIERSKLPPTDDRYWRTQVEETPPTDFLDTTVPAGLERLLGMVDPQWLETEARKPYRLDKAFLQTPLHLVSGTRIDSVRDGGPQRFARMLLVCQDHVTKRGDLDFFTAAMLVPEVASLGNSLDLIPALGEEARRKLGALHLMEDDLVAATVYELLVGTACRRKGLDLTMQSEDRSRKVPDYRVHGLGPLPGAIECKRRLGLTKYELDEARHIERLYASIRPTLQERGAHGSIEASFRLPVQSVDAGTFAGDVLPLVRQDQDSPPVNVSWGQVAFRRLPYHDQIPFTRLYSPEYLERVFGWDSLEEDWDGLLCEVEAPPAILVTSYTLPLCLKWRSESEEALTKKARGVISLWANAVRQIPSGEIGFVYIAYPEGGRPIIADARTRRILKDWQEVWHRWSVRIPLTIINRLYPRPLGCGVPDLIESTLPGAAEGEELWLAKFPSLVFTQPLTAPKE